MKQTMMLLERREAEINELRVTLAKLRAEVAAGIGPLSLVAKLAAVVVHADEATGARGTEADFMALRQVVEDREVQAWLKAIGPLAPVKR
jgi:hypothetical protein